MYYTLEIANAHFSRLKNISRYVGLSIEWSDCRDIGSGEEYDNMSGLRKRVQCVEGCLLRFQ